MVKYKKQTARMLTAVMLIACIGVPAGSAKAEGAVQEYVVMVENDNGYSKVETLSSKTEEVQSEETGDNHFVVAQLTEKEAVKLERDKDIAFVEENIILEGCDFEDETFEDFFGPDVIFEDDAQMKQFLKEIRETENVSVPADEQWNIDVINANGGEYEKVTDTVKVAVLDTGVTATEDIDVAGRVNLIPGEEDVNPLYEDVSGHGTSVASVIGAKNNGIGVTGINPNAELYSVKVLDDEKKASLSRVIEGIYWCMDRDIDIINMSFGTGVESEILEQVIKEADEKGILMVAAAGNQGGAAGTSTVEYPAAYEEVIAVGAMNPQGKTSEISSVGKEVDLMAPGETVPAAGYYDEIIKTEGTSMAAPHVTGAASVLWAKDKSKSGRFIRELLKASARPMEDQTMQGSGLIDLNYALSIYDDFAAGYEENTLQEYPVKENTGEIPAYTDEEVEASWHWGDHQSAVGGYDQTSASALSVMKEGAKIPDIVSYLKYNKGTTDSFHGHYNYVANYIYVMRMARICFNSGMSEALSQAKYPCTDDGEKQIYNGIVKLNKNWSSVLSGYTVNDKNKARILVGIATHIAMDVYAHKAYIKDANGDWMKHISGDSKQDDTTYVPCRYTCAKKIAYDIVDVWHFGMSPSAEEFHMSVHDKNKFKLLGFYKKVSQADPVTYNKYSTWFKERTTQKNVLEEI